MYMYMHVHVYINLMHYGVCVYMNEPNVSLYLGVSIIVYHVSACTSILYIAIRVQLITRNLLKLLAS